MTIVLPAPKAYEIILMSFPRRKRMILRQQDSTVHLNSRFLAV
jgi:hypothetical protein